MKDSVEKFKTPTAKTLLISSSEEKIGS